MQQTIYYAIIAIILLSFALDRILSYLNSKTWKVNLPEDLKEFYTEEEYQKARNYNKERRTFSLILDSLNLLILLLFFTLGGFKWLNDSISPLIENKILLPLLYFGIIFFATDLFSTPFSFYSTFVIEEKYGFNKTTVKTFILDKLKSYLLVLIIGGGIGALLIWLILFFGPNFWIVAFVVMTAFSLFITVFYSSLIIPIFNKLEPLEEGELRKKIMDYAKSVDFPLTNVFVMDGSKRSAKANAFFTGLGKRKKIVLYDTLIEKHNPDELLAILAHEVGHYKKKHIIKGFVISSTQSFIMLYILSLLLFEPLLTNAFGIEGNTYVLHINLIALALLFEPINLISGLFGNQRSRKYEFQADAFAVETTKNKFLAEALKRLSVDQLSNLKPHPAYVFFYYSHPTMLQRLQAIKNMIINE
ncbi:MAG: M48 family metallopeptidase [Bacteroidetes bacterium]|nr:M48 family metallopeptidase [Bacteroidota bacterium]